MSHQPPAADSSASMFRALFTPQATTQRLLAFAQLDPRHKPELYGALLLGRVYVLDYDVLLTDAGPELELGTRRDRRGHTVHLYSGRNRLPVSRDPLEADAMPFVTVLRWLPHEVSICIDPGHLDFWISLREADMLRRLMPESDA